ncbi:CoA binding domain-containing protein [Mycena latifolia]|nr:CoA binding domain-containing protein [Mycena latifolia]
MTTKKTTTLDKRGLFLSATKFAVVGASTNPSKNGSKALKWLLDHHKDVTPVNLKASEIQGIKCVKTLSELPDPTHTSVSIVVPPKATLEVLQQAKALGIFALWLQPGAEDDAVVNFIQADAQLDERCIYRMHALHEHTPAPSRTRSKPDPLSTSTNLPPKTAASINTKSAETATPDRRALFLGASKFAVVGASANPAKNGFKALKWLVEHHKDVVPINLKASEIQGIKCMKALSELPDPTHKCVYRGPAESYTRDPAAGESFGYLRFVAPARRRGRCSGKIHPGGRATGRAMHLQEARPARPGPLC